MVLCFVMNIAIKPHISYVHFSLYCIKVLETNVLKSTAYGMVLNISSGVCAIDFHVNTIRTNENEAVSLLCTSCTSVPFQYIIS